MPMLKELGFRFTKVIIEVKIETKIIKLIHFSLFLPRTLPMNTMAFQVAPEVKNPPANTGDTETWV